MNQKGRIKLICSFVFQDLYSFCLHGVGSSDFKKNVSFKCFISLFINAHSHFGNQVVSTSNQLRFGRIDFRRHVKRLTLKAILSAYKNMLNYAISM